MKAYEFFAKYANTLLANRLIGLDMQGTTLQDLYRDIENLETQMRPLRIQQQKLLQKAEEGFKGLEAARKKTFG